MLLLVTIGLVLIAAVTLVIGFVSNSLAPIIVSIVCSALAAIVLTVYYKMHRSPRSAAAGYQPRGSKARSRGPSPLVDTTPPVFASSAPAPRRHGPSVVTGAGSSARSSLDDADDAQYDDRPRFAEPPVAVGPPTRQFRRVPPAPPRAPAPPPAPIPAPAPAPAPAPEPVAAAPAWTPPPRPEPLAVAETPTAGAGPAGFASMPSRPAPLLPEPEPEPAPPAPPPPPPPPPPAPAPEPAPALPSPIEGYDELRVIEIIPLLAEMAPGELEDLRAYEQANRKRVAVISRIDTLLTVPDEPATADEGADEVEPTGPSADNLPIADYDFLGVSEILPLLAELDPEELVEVRGYEEVARGRATILYRIEALIAAATPPAEPEPEPEPEPVAASEPVAAAPEPEAAVASEGASFPIDNYDRLRVFQILSLLADLDDGALQAVRDYEQAGRSRITILNEIDARLAAAAAEAPPAAPPEPQVPAPAPEVAAATPEPESSPVSPGDAAGLPIADYDDLTQLEILGLLEELYEDELEQVREYEDAGRARAAILFRIDALLDYDEAPEGVEVEGAAEEATEAEPEPQPEAVDEEEPEPEAAPPAAEEDGEWGEWPIADYDDLTQLEILPLLDELYEDELEQIRDYEDANRARAAILFRINSLLTGEDEPAPGEPEEATEAAPDEPEPEAEEEPVAAPPAPAAPEEPDEADVPAIDVSELAIADYDVLTVSEILPLLAELEDDELWDVRDYEDANIGRTVILSRIDALLEPYDEEPEDELEDEEPAEEAAEEEAAPAEEPAEEAEPADEAEPAEEAEPADEAPAAEVESAPAPEPPAPEPVAEEPAAEDEEFEEEEYEEEEEVPAAAGDDAFPIADYDDLRETEILPLLSQLEADELQVVARHEEQGGNRASILSRIGRLLELSGNS